jgi:hypothetical protein
LKKRYGVGYNLTIVKNTQEETFNLYNLNNIDDYLKEKLGEEIKMLQDVGQEVSF